MPDSDTIEALTGLIEALNQAVADIGFGKCLLAALLFIGIPWAFRAWTKRKEWQAAEAEREQQKQTIQRLAAEARDYRIAFFKSNLGFSDEEIERLCIGGEYVDAQSARDDMEAKVRKLKEIKGGSGG